MPKMKTNSSAKKRFKKLKSGKFKMSQSMRRHILTKKTTKRKRHLRSGAYVGETNLKRVRLMLPN